MMFKKLEIWGDGDNSDTEVVIRTLRNVDVCWYATNRTATAYDKANKIVATMETFDDYPIAIFPVALRITGIVLPEYAKAESSRSPFGFWQCYQ